MYIIYIYTYIFPFASSGVGGRVRRTIRSGCEYVCDGDIQSDANGIITCTTYTRERIVGLPHAP